MVLTESGLMTATDHRAHVRRPVAGLNWTEFRDCFLRYQEDTADRHPAKVSPACERKWRSGSPLLCCCSTV